MVKRPEAPTEEFARALGRRVREARAVQGISIREAAHKLQCSPRFVHQLEHGKPTARMDKVVQTLSGLGLQVSIGALQPPALPDPEWKERLSARTKQALYEERLG